MTRQLEPQAAKRWQPLPAACTVPTTCARRHLQETGCEVAAARSRRRGGGCPVRRALRRCPLQGAMVRPCASPATRTAAQAPSAAKARGAAASRRWRPAWGAALRLRARRDERRDAQSGLAEPVRGWPLAASLEAVELMSLVAYALASMHAKRRPAASSCADRSTAYRPARARSARGPLEQGLLNLLSNALKYKRTGGRVLVQPEPGAKRWRLVVEDNGHGQSAGLRALVSVPFERLGAASDDDEGRHAHGASPWQVAKGEAHAAPQFARESAPTQAKLTPRHVTRSGHSGGPSLRPLRALSPSRGCGLLAGSAGRRASAARERSALDAGPRLLSPLAQPPQQPPAQQHRNERGVHATSAKVVLAGAHPEEVQQRQQRHGVDRRCSACQRAAPRRRMARLNEVAASGSISSSASVPTRMKLRLAMSGRMSATSNPMSSQA
jgi:hypothetical protein